jgi:putative transposase
MVITVNSLYEIRGDDLKVQSTERVLWVAPDQSDIVLINVSNEKAWPKTKPTIWLLERISEGRARKLEKDPYLYKPLVIGKITLEQIEKREKLRDEAWRCIQELVEYEPYIFDESYRYEHINQVLAKTGKRYKYIYKHIRNYWVRGKSRDALLPSFYACGGKGKRKNPNPGIKLGRKRSTAYEKPELNGIGVDETIRNIFDAAISEHYKKRDKHPVRFAYCKMLGEYFNIGSVMKRGVLTPELKEDHEVPSLDQFRYHLRTREDQRKILEVREGERQYLLKYRPKLGSATTRAQGPGHIYEIDATMADVYLVSKCRTKIIGRPIVYLVIDVYSRMIVGMHVALYGPSWEGAMMAIDNTVSDKVAFCEEFDINITANMWPCNFLPEFILADRGEMEGLMSDCLPGIGTKIINAPPYRADLKGIIEQKFHTINIKLGPYLPGHIKREYKVRGGPKYIHDAKLTMKGFTGMMIEMILAHNNHQFIKEYPGEKGMIPDNVPPIPNRLWSWGVMKSGGFFQDRPREFVRFSMMDRANVVATDEGIRFQGMDYGSVDLLNEGWFINGKSKKATIAYDRRCMNQIYIISDDEKFVPCDLLPSSRKFKNLFLEEILMIQFDDKVMELEHRKEVNQSFQDLDAQLSRIEHEETVLTEQAIRNSGVTNNQRQNDRHESRKIERTEQRKYESFVPNSTLDEASNKPDIMSNKLETVDIDDSIFDLLAQIN